ncbi:putative ATPase [Paraburkholderia sp. HC6.4b]|uniref:AAA family ATPase n=1 Tax=unclassified Paraburkholderia TaxID=2615204 RepID=UPI00161EDE1D|nr:MULTISPECIES: AAA family ATPase [unclassified Paraburkholderia]MBB5411040.1 putative ATPase [Paraburkholderia sp. HC6.4b]MBB5455156.1 putative ATPase [Paraburkholderia sp. Kb1A]
MAQLFLVCRECNTEKSNFFPVDDERRATLLSTWDEANSIESGTLLNPCEDNPQGHLDFTLDGHALPLSLRAAKTIDVLALNRPQLVQERAHQIAQCIESMEIARHKADALLQVLEQILDDKTPHAGAMRIILTEVGHRLAKHLGRSRPMARKLIEGLAQLLVSLESDVHVAEFCPNTDQAQSGSAAFSVKNFAAAPQSVDWPSHQSPIKRVEIHNFRGIEDLTLDLNGGWPSDKRMPGAMLLGENAAGKSSILQAIALCLMGSTMREKMGIQASDLLSRETKNWQLTRTRDCFVRVTLADRSEVELRIDAVNQKFEGTASAAATIHAFGARRFFKNEQRRRTRVDSARTLFDPLWTLADPIAWLQGLSRGDFYSVARAMREIFALQRDDELKLDERGNILVRAHSRDTPIQQMSEGYRSVFGMTVTLMRNLLDGWSNFEEAQGIVLIDEIETHLHPRWKIQVVSALRNAFPRVQFIATTHDPLCLRGMQKGEVHVLYRDEENRIRELQDLPDVNALRTDQLLTSDFFGLSSTAAPEFESKLDTFASLSANSTSDQQRQHLSTLAAEIEDTMLIGDTPLRQIVTEATREFVRRYEATPLAERSQLRQDSVKAVLDALIRARDA